MSCKDNTAINNIFGNSAEAFSNIFSEFKNLEEPNDIVHVLPRFELPLTENEKNQLENEISPNKSSEHDGVDVFANVLEFIYDRNRR